MTNDPQPAPSGPRKGWTWALVAVLVVLAIFAAWQAHELWFSLAADSRRPELPAGAARPRPARPAARTRPVRRLPTLPAPMVESQPDTSPFEGEWEEPAVEPLEDDPVGIPPPPDANGRGAHRMPDSSVVARYEWAGTVAGAADHYRKALAEANCRLLDDSPREGGSQVLVFEGPGRRVVVALHPRPPEARMVRIEVTVVRPSR
jgi:hypothetical protein